MKSSKAIAAGAFMLAMAASGAVHADSGTIVVTGQLLGQNCLINGATQDTANITVTVPLPTVSRTALRTAGSTTGLTPFEIVLSDCPAGTFYMHFEANTNTNLDVGTLRNTSTGTDAATNVEVQLLNNAMQPINIVTNANSQRGTVAAAGGAATFRYYMRYLSLGSSTAGNFTSRLGFTLAYN